MKFSVELRWQEALVASQNGGLIAMVFGWQEDKYGRMVLACPKSLPTKGFGKKKKRTKKRKKI